MIAVLGAGPHGRQIAALYDHTMLYDDNLPGYGPVLEGAERHHWLVGAAWPHVRRHIAEKVAHVALGTWKDGLVRFPHAFVGNDVALGGHVHLGPNCTVSHGATLGDYVTVCAGAVIAGEAVIGDGVFVGANATILHGGIKVGDGAVIGAGAVVTQDVEPRTTVVGNPARTLCHR